MGELDQHGRVMLEAFIGTKESHIFKNKDLCLYASTKDNKN